MSEDRKELVAVADAAIKALVKLVHQTLPGYPEEQMMIAPDISVAKAREVIAKASQEPK